jgi:N-acetylmuramoyl-L-alanine amidase
MLNKYIIASIFVCGLLFLNSIKAEENKNNIEQKDTINSVNLQDTKVQIEPATITEEQAKEENLTGYTGPINPVGAVIDVNFTQINSNVYNLVFTVTKSFLADVKILNFPFRLMVDIPMPYEWKIEAKNISNKIPVTLIESFRYGNPSKNIFRFVADLGRAVTILKVDVENRADGNFDFIVQFSYGSTNTSSVASKSIVFVQNKENLQQIANIASNAQQAELDRKRDVSSSVKISSYLKNISYPAPIIEYNNRPVVIMLDPGHGGKDPGAIDEKSGLVEKTLVLEIALLVKQELELLSNEIAVVLSRRDDYYVPLKDRILWAEQFKSAVFVSLHADKAEGSTLSSGLSIYTLSEVASDTQAQILANNANKSDTVAGVDISKEDDIVNRVLASLSQRVKVNESIFLARNVLGQGLSNVKILTNPIRSAGFAVLKVPNIPSILIELGFLSNEGDIKNFMSLDYKKKLAKSIALGISGYLFDRKIIKTLPKDINVDALKNANIER